VRLFVAVNFSEAVRQRIHEAGDALRALAPQLRWVSPERLHLTVRFLGEQPISMVPELRMAIDGAVAGHADAPLLLGGVGAFPNFRRARVLWVGVAPHPRLELLYHDVEAACVALGFEPEGRAFRPHVTLARVPDGIPEETLRALSRAARGVAISESLSVESVALMASEQTPAGPSYRLLHASRLLATA